LVEIDLVTGRTHQIRAHMAHIGHPLLGDGKYGINRDDKARGYKYQALYAYRLVFDFGKDEGYLGYLSGKQVNLAPDDVWFVSEFSGAFEKIEKIISSYK
jgi:23S rRNA pseudouridine955/2504/2580 synthase